MVLWQAEAALSASSIQIRDIPEDAYETIRRRAKAEGKSLQSYMRDQIVTLARPCSTCRCSPPTPGWPARPACVSGGAGGLTLVGHQAQRDGVYAVPLVGGGVVALALEDVPEVAVAGGAQHLGAHHPE